MPQLSAFKLIILEADSEDDLFSDLQNSLRQVRHDLENEVAEAIVDENIALAERLMFPISRLRKLSEQYQQVHKQRQFRRE